MSEIVNLAITNGLWAALFVGLMIYILKDARVREAKYVKVIADLTNNMKLINEIKNDVKDIKEKINEKPRHLGKSTTCKNCECGKKIS